MTSFDFNALGELYPARNTRFRGGGLKYKRFDRAAEAVRYAIEELPPELLGGAILEVDEQRLDARAIRALYDSADYPLPRRAGD